VTINVFDARGAHVATLVDAVTPAGAYTVTWNGHDDRGDTPVSSRAVSSQRRLDSHIIGRAQLYR
jgi:hypothetical protein